MNELLILFIVLNAINVVIQTIKSLCTINCGKTIAALVNALAYGFYTVVVIYMVCDLPLLWMISSSSALAVSLFSGKRYRLCI